MINHLKLDHFKAFRDPAELDLGGKNVLIYGENGAGKSSLYQALKIIFHRQRIFETNIPASVVDPNARRNAENDVLGRYNYQPTPLTNFTLEIDGTDYRTFSTVGYNVCMISREDILAEDEVDVADLLGRTMVGIQKPIDFINDKKSTIESYMNIFLKDYFYEDHLTVALTFNNPRWILTIKDSSRVNPGRNEALTFYFNEAKLHIIKLLLLLTAVLDNGAEGCGEQRVLVLDDVISSMDSANRTLFIKLLKDFFDDFQKIVLTHSISFFNLFEYSFQTAYRQKGEWKLYQIVEHDGNSEIVERESQDFSGIIRRDYKPGKNEGVIGNRIRKRFEYLAGEVSKLICTGGVGESSQMLKAILAPKKLYYECDNNTKHINTVYDMVDELTAIIDADPGSPLKLKLDPVIARYVSGTELVQLRNTLCELMVYQKVTMHPLSHATGSMSLSTQTEVYRSLSLLQTLEKQIGKLTERDLYSM